MPGIRMSVIKHEHSYWRPDARNSSPDANAHAGNPASSRRSSNASRTGASSSTTATHLGSLGLTKCGRLVT